MEAVCGGQQTAVSRIRLCHPSLRRHANHNKFFDPPCSRTTMQHRRRPVRRPYLRVFQHDLRRISPAAINLLSTVFVFVRSALSVIRVNGTDLDVALRMGFRSRYYIGTKMHRKVAKDTLWSGIFGRMGQTLSPVISDQNLR